MHTWNDEIDTATTGRVWVSGEPLGCSVDGRLRMEMEDLEALRRREAQYSTIVDLAPVGIVLTDQNGLILVANPAFQQMLGYSEDELLSRASRELTHPDDLPASLGLAKRLQAGHRSAFILDKRYIRKDGTLMWARVSMSALVDSDGHPNGFIAMQEDITERREIEEALHESETRHRQMFERNHAVQLLIDPDTGEIVDANPAACTFYGASRDDLRATTIHTINVLSADIVAAEMTRAQREERDYFVFRHRLWSGEERDVEVHSSPIQVDGRPLLYSIVHDITERKRVEAELIHHTLHDALTGLPNRILLHDRLEQAILRAQRDGLPLALLVLDLDRFKEINDTFGHDVGDLLLQQMGHRLQQIVRSSDSLVRLVPATWWRRVRHHSAPCGRARGARGGREDTGHGARADPGRGGTADGRRQRWYGSVPAAWKGCRWLIAARRHRHVPGEAGSRGICGVRRRAG
jgi:PAS domain S-box-containing protein